MNERFHEFWHDRQNELQQRIFPGMKSGFHQLKEGSAHSIGRIKGSLAASSASAAAATTMVFGDRDLTAQIGSWLSSNFNALSNEYTRAMDGDLQAAIKEAGVSAHRWVTESHGPIGSIEAARNALPDDTDFQEIVG